MGYVTLFFFKGGRQLIVDLMEGNKMINKLIYLGGLFALIFLAFYQKCTYCFDITYWSEHQSKLPVKWTFN